jgi:hypothetical protein
MANLNQFCNFTKIIGIDIAKSVFQIYSCDTQTGEITNVQVKRIALPIAVNVLLAWKHAVAPSTGLVSCKHSAILSG